jgi:acetyltransferase
MLPAPENWTASDGTPVTIRPISAADLELETEFVNALSPATGYLRLMSARRPSPDELRHFTDIDYAHEMALIAVTTDGGRERQVGVARYVKNSSVPGEAEFAIVLSDDWQNRGLGRKLLSSLFAAAKRDGVRRIVGTTSSANSAMLALAGKMGFKRTLQAGSASTTTLTLEL